MNFNKSKYKLRSSIEKTYDFTFGIYCIMFFCQTLVRKRLKDFSRRIYYIILYYIPYFTVGLHRYYAINVSDVNLVLHYFRNKRLMQFRGLNCGRSLTEHGGNREL